MHYGNNMELPRKTKNRIHLPRHFTSAHSWRARNSTYHRDTNTSFIIAALVTVGRKWSQPRFLSMVHGFLKGKWNFGPCRKMNRTRNHYFKQSKPDSDKYHVSLCDPLCVCVFRSWKKGTMKGEANKHLKWEKRTKMVFMWLNKSHFHLKRIPWQTREMGPLKSALAKLLIYWCYLHEHMWLKSTHITQKCISNEWYYKICISAAPCPIYISSQTAFFGLGILYCS